MLTAGASLRATRLRMLSSTRPRRLLMARVAADELAAAEGPELGLQAASLRSASLPIDVAAARRVHQCRTGEIMRLGPFKSHSVRRSVSLCSPVRCRLSRRLRPPLRPAWTTHILPRESSGSLDAPGTFWRMWVGFCSTKWVQTSARPKHTHDSLCSPARGRAATASFGSPSWLT